MAENSTPVGTISDTDRHLMDRVHQIVVQAKISAAFLQMHLTEEYQLSPTRTIGPDGRIWETALDQKDSG